MRRILIVEDEFSISSPLALSLRREGFECALASDGNSGLRMALEDPPDLVILDLKLPGLDGLSVCRRLRESSSVPILMLTAQQGERDEVLGFETGADDYVTKPFSLAILKSRIRSLLRRSGDPPVPPRQPLCFGRLEIDVAGRIARLGGEELELTPTEFALLAFLAQNPGRAFTREQLLDQVWKYRFDGYRRTVDTHVNRLRAKIEEDPQAPTLILTVYKFGYKFAPGDGSGEAAA